MYITENWYKISGQIYWLKLLLNCFYRHAVHPQSLLYFLSSQLFCFVLVIFFFSLLLSCHIVFLFFPARSNSVVNRSVSVLLYLISAEQC